MSQPYKVFNSAEFTDRGSEFERVKTILKERSRAALIFEGERGSGKTTLLFELFRRLNQQRELRPFLISLFPYSAPEFKDHENIWINTEREFQKDDIPAVLNQLARYLEIESIETAGRDYQKDYFARGLAYRSSKTIPVLLVDSIYECADDVRIELEKYILSPILASERVIIILSGRGKPPIWAKTELQNADITKLLPLQNSFAMEQLEKLEKSGKSKRNRKEYEAIIDLSGGYPLIVRVMADSNKPFHVSLNDAINIVIEETLPKRERENLENIRPLIEKLALVDIPFRPTDIDEYLYGNDPDRRAKTSDLISLLLASYLLRYEGKGYQLNRSVVHPIRKWLALKGQGAEYIEQLKQTSARLQEKSSSAKAWYQRMLPAETTLPKDVLIATNTNQIHYAS